MSKKVKAIFFSIAFLLFITAPTIITVVDSTIDVSVIFSISEEEEKNNEEGLNIQIYFTPIILNQSQLFLTKIENNLEFFVKNYTKPHLNIISPPPDFKLITV
ncbi:hypothetical protein [Tenacibaculum ovolyticum]|uniref:hypothetical protein n=1 Tax=Tenacibaculum ovolyticum TaxID=104270 RepID=UPI001F317E40|nr:hypothetical protein [Tenacibaculum ovolyticum]